MKTKLSDLTDHLFLAMERLNEERDEDEQPDAYAERIRGEIARAGAITNVAREIVSVGKLAVDATRLRNDLGGHTPPPRLLGLDDGAEQ